jgi:hypothetical protein
MLAVTQWQVRVKAQQAVGGAGERKAACQTWGTGTWVPVCRGPFACRSAGQGCLDRYA